MSPWFLDEQMEKRREFQIDRCCCMLLSVKLFNAKIMETLKACQEYFRFELLSVKLHVQRCDYVGNEI